MQDRRAAIAEIQQALPYFYSSAEATFVKDDGRAPIDFSGVRRTGSECFLYPCDGLSDHKIVVATISGTGGLA